MYAIKNDTATFEEGRGLEQAGDLAGAIKVYEKMFKRFPSGMRPIQRLMIIHHKLKEYKKELEYVNAAIAIQSAYYNNRLTSGPKVQSLSKKLNAMLGHTDKKGKALTVPPEIARLQLRKAGLLKKLKRK